MNRYFKCTKCGATASTVDTSVPSVCVTPDLNRTSGCCGGYFIEITEAHFLIECGAEDGRAIARGGSGNFYA